MSGYIVLLRWSLMTLRYLHKQLVAELGNWSVFKQIHHLRRVWSRLNIFYNARLGKHAIWLSFD